MLWRISLSDNSPRILIVDDERSIRRFLHDFLTAHDYSVLEADTGESALGIAASSHLDVIILDLGLPDMDGVEVTRRLKEWSSVPIIVLSVKETEQDKVAALDAGADDYLTKPFGNEELLARIRVALRHAIQTGSEPIIQVDQLRIDFSRHLVTMDGKEISLTATEYELLAVLAQNAGKVITHEHILRQVWGGEYRDGGHLLQVTLSNLRRKIEPDPSRPYYIKTEMGVGYRFRLPI